MQILPTNCILLQLVYDDLIYLVLPIHSSVLQSRLLMSDWIQAASYIYHLEPLPWRYAISK